MLHRLTAIVAAAGVATGCAPPDCDNVDHGSCVEACCKLRFTFAKANATDVAKGIADLFSKGGPDGRYEYWGTVPHQGPLDNVVQGTHKTLKCNITGAPCYTDSLTFGVSQDGAAATVVAFSHSQDFIKGDFAYGDVGQNYKNLVTIAKAIPAPAFSQEILFGCPAPQSAVSAKTAAQTKGGVCCCDPSKCLCQPVGGCSVSAKAAAQTEGGVCCCDSSKCPCQPAGGCPAAGPAQPAVSAKAKAQTEGGVCCSTAPTDPYCWSSC